MAKTSRRALRFASEADMPPSMRALLRGKDAAPAAAAAPTSPPPRTNKFGNVATVVDGIRFASKKEARYYEQLKLLQAAGIVEYFLRQVAVHLPGGTRYVIDFLVFFIDPARKPEYVDVKGRETPMFRVKRREIEHHYPFKVVLV